MRVFNFVQIRFVCRGCNSDTSDRNSARPSSPCDWSRSRVRDRCWWCHAHSRIDCISTGGR